VTVTSSSGVPGGSLTEKQDNFQTGTVPALKVAWLDGRVTKISKREFQMLNSFTSARQTATLFAGAFITALLFVSAATSVPIA